MGKKTSWKMMCTRCKILLLSRRQSVACPQCGRECRPDVLTPQARQPFKVRNGQSGITQVCAATASNVRRGGDLRSTPVFNRRLGGVEVTVHETETRAGAISYTARLTYSYPRPNTRKWEFSENIPAGEIWAAIRLLEQAEEFIEQQAEQTRAESQDA